MLGWPLRDLCSGIHPARWTLGRFCLSRRGARIAAARAVQADVRWPGSVTRHSQSVGFVADRATCTANPFGAPSRTSTNCRSPDYSLFRGAGDLSVQWTAGFWRTIGIEKPARPAPIGCTYCKLSPGNKTEIAARRAGQAVFLTNRRKSISAGRSRSLSTSTSSTNIELVYWLADTFLALPPPVFDEAGRALWMAELTASRSG